MKTDDLDPVSKAVLDYQSVRFHVMVVSLIVNILIIPAFLLCVGVL